MIGLGIAAFVITLLGAAPLEVHTATRDVRDCHALADGGYVAATDGGVVFLDAAGVAERPLTILDGLPETRSSMVEPVAGSSTALWIGSEGGLARIERSEAGVRVSARYDSAPVRALVEHDGRTFVGTWGEGVLELVGDTLVPVPGPALAKADRVSALVVHADRVVAASAGAGAWVLGETPTPIDAIPSEGLEGVVWSLAVHDGSLHAGTLAGVRKLEGSRSITVSTHDARALESVAGELLIGSRGQGLAGLDRGPLVTHVQGLDRDRCVATPEGLWIRAGERWITTLNSGLPSGDITAMLQVNDALYVGTFEHGLAVYRDGVWQTVADPDHALDPQINALAPAGDGRVWVATTRGLHRVGSGTVETWTKKAGLPHANVLSLATLANGELVVGTHAGVVLVDTKGDVRSLGTRARSWATWAIAEGRNGSLWLGTTRGLIQWKRDGTWTNYSMLSGHLSDNWVTALVVEGAALHVGTYAGGVDTLTATDPSAEQWTAESLGSGRINPGGLSLVNGRLLASTMKGLLIRRGDRWQPRAEAALYEDVTGALATSAGLWISSRRGLVLSAISK